MRASERKTERGKCKVRKKSYCRARETKKVIQIVTDTGRQREKKDKENRQRSGKKRKVDR